MSGPQHGGSSRLQVARLRRAAVAIVGVAALVPRASAEELAVLAGQSEAHPRDSYAWQLEYRQPLARFLEVSFSYLNEGHLFGHQRDGGAAQVWAVTPRWGDHVELAFGAGPYFYFDTQELDGEAQARDRHGVAEIYTGSLTYYGVKGWFARLNVNEIHAPGDVDTRGVLLGVGYWLNAPLEPSSGQSASRGAVGDLATQQLGVFGGKTIENNFYDDRSTAFGVEYRYLMDRHVEFSAAWLNEGDGASGRHNGVLVEGWLVDEVFTPRFAVGIGAGPYIALQPYLDTERVEAERLTGMASMTASYRLTDWLVWRFTWHRSFSRDNEDRDILVTQIAYSFGH
ncbi:MAG TPA: hypothetical protein VMD49_01265 [Steroidobacteraceae bacterium]|nr:hypothetical protein [Steroidobacteraceae bacterium]